MQAGRSVEVLSSWSARALDYDGARGQVERVRERDGSEVRRAYNDRGKLVRVVDPLGRETKFAYGLWTEPDHIQTPDGHVLAYTYRGREAQERIHGPSSIAHRQHATVEVVIVDHA